MHVTDLQHKFPRRSQSSESLLTPVGDTHALVTNILFASRIHGGDSTSQSTIFLLVRPGWVRSMKL